MLVYQTVDKNDKKTIEIEPEVTPVLIAPELYYNVTEFQKQCKIKEISKEGMKDLDKNFANDYVDSIVGDKIDVFIFKCNGAQKERSVPLIVEMDTQEKEKQTQEINSNNEVIMEMNVEQNENSTNHEN